MVSPFGEWPNAIGRPRNPNSSLLRDRQPGRRYASNSLQTIEFSRVQVDGTVSMMAGEVGFADPVGGSPTRPVARLHTLF
uniref:Uncharacterized protein n=1 Tax=Solanum tuberosum TaxID=4113 RepID=M1DPY6_SOLTU